MPLVTTANENMSTVGILITSNNLRGESESVFNCSLVPVPGSLGKARQLINVADTKWSEPMTINGSVNPKFGLPSYERSNKNNKNNQYSQNSSLHWIEKLRVCCAVASLFGF